MLDPLTALGVAGNVLQIIDFGFQLVTDGNQIYHSSTGALEENKATDELAQDLQSLVVRLFESQTQWQKAHGDNPLDPDEVHLRNICDRCTEIAVELRNQLQNLRRLDGQQKYRRLKSYKQALISVWRKDHVDAIAARLARYQQELDTHILIGLRRSIQEADWKNSQQFAALEAQTQDLTIAVLEGNDRIVSNLNNHTDTLARIEEQTNQILLTLGSDGKRSISPAPPYESITSSHVTTLLHEAAAAGDILKLKQLLRPSNLDINARDKDGCAPLHVASTFEAAKRLLGERNIEKNLEDNEGRTALHCAVLKRRLDVIKALLEGGVDKSIPDDRGKTAHYYAQDCPTALFQLKYGPEIDAQAYDHLNNTGLITMAWMGDIEGTRFYLDQGADVNARNKWQETALTESCRHGSTKIVEILIKAGAKLELGVGNEWTPLHQAVRDNRVEVVRLLLRHGSIREAKLKNGNTALIEACQKGYWEIAEMLIDAGCNIEITGHAQKTPLILAATADRHALVRTLVRKRANKDIRDAHGATAVHAAADPGHIESLKILLEAGANPNVFANDGWTPLGQACVPGRYECVKLLLEHGADVNAYQRHASGFTALGEASHHGRINVIELLLEFGARMDLCCPVGFSALSSAAMNGQNAAVSLLASRGADIEQRGFGNRDPELDKTPLMRATIYGHVSTVELLLHIGAEINSRDAYGSTALYYAAKKGCSQAVNALIAHGADVDVATTGGATPLMAAANEGFVEIAQQLLEANANTRLRDWRGCTAWTIAVNMAHDRELEHLLRPAPDEHETLHRLQADRSPAEIAAYMNDNYH